MQPPGPRIPVFPPGKGIPYVPLRVHSDYSFLRGADSIQTLCRAAADRGMKAMALTDTDGVSGAVSFWSEAREAGLAPILGAEVTVPGQQPVTLLAQNTAGWRRLCHILTARHLDRAFSVGRALMEDRRNLTVLASDPGLLGALARETGLADLYLALDRGKPRQGLLAFARRAGLQPVASPRVFFAHPGRYPLHRLLRAIALNTKLSRLPASEIASPLAWLMPPAEVARAFVDCPHAVARSMRLAEQCAMESPPWSGFTFPSFRGMTETQALAELRRRCESGLRRRYGTVTHRHRSRLEHEMGLVAEKGFAGYFLVVHDIVSRWPRTCGRGSAAASLIAYTLGITHVDPVRHDLFFPRFLNHGRTDPPDIDVDFAWDERDQVLASVLAHDGPARAAMVCTHVRFRGRAAVRETAKVYGLPNDEITTVTRRLAHVWQDAPVAEMVHRHPLFSDLDLKEPWPAILAWAARLEGHPRHLSVHPGGVIIVPTCIADHVPMQPSAKGINIIQWDKDAAEEAGLVKIDLLGNRSLAVIRDALRAVELHDHVSIPYDTFDPLEDPRTRHLLATGKTVGVFYVESPSMRQLQRKTGHGDFKHLVIHSSIIRPAANSYIREYIRRLHGGRYQPIHPLLQHTMPDTYGIMVYQEDVARMAIAMAEFGAADADDLRKVLAKKHKTRRLQAYQKRFLEGAVARGFSPQVVAAVWDMILSFAGYSFCKPHSASYALVSFKAAYLKAHYPAEFMAAVLSNQGGYYSSFAYISECRRMGLVVELPDVNQSHIAYTGLHRRIRIGLVQIRGLSATARSLIVTERARGPFHSFENFLRRVPLDPGDLRLLIRAGACDSIAGGRTRPQLIWRTLEREEARRRKGALKPPLSRGRGTAMGPLLPLFDGARDPIPEAAPLDPLTVLRHEVNALGFLASRHPLTLYRRHVQHLPIVNGKDLERHVGRKVLTIGWFVTGKVVDTRTDEPMEFVSFEDTTALYEATFFPTIYRKFCRMLTHTRPYLLRGRVEEDFGAVTLTVENLRFLDARESPPGRMRRRELSFNRKASRTPSDPG
ncbi:MAG: DNA polymerase III subunit alpha [Acidobacteriota bacterium]